ncbi:hypothetical protein NC652_027538 [Populus alba x Populus x berolinensis]|nr:hypothetical protein NC652_027538 [Populus alba x Populus x berolinensis]
MGHGKVKVETLHPTDGGSLTEKFETFMCTVWGGDRPSPLARRSSSKAILLLSICSSSCIFSTRHAPIQSIMGVDSLPMQPSRPRR